MNKEIILSCRHRLVLFRQHCTKDGRGRIPVTSALCVVQCCGRSPQSLQGTELWNTLKDPQELLSPAPGLPRTPHHSYPMPESVVQCSLELWQPWGCGCSLGSLGSA